MKPQLKAIIFDFDGLLFNSEPIWDRAYDRFLQMKHLKDEITEDTTGMGLRDYMELWKQHRLVGDTDKLMAEYRAVFYDLFLKEKNVLMSGALEILTKVGEERLTIAMTSGGHAREKLLEMLKAHNILHFFSVVVSSDDVQSGKPAPDVYFECLKELSLKAGDCLALEDSANGVLAAKAAGIRVYGVNPDEGMREELEGAGADRVYKSLLEIDL